MKELPSPKTKGHWLGTVRGLFRKESEVNIPKLRVLVEGADYDTWKRLRVVPWEQTAPVDCTKINFKDHYVFSLVGRWTKNGIQTVDAKELDSGSEVEFDNASKLFFGVFSRPTTIITEDGRIYHDLTLIKSQRLSSFLQGLIEKYGKNNPANANSLVEKK